MPTHPEMPYGSARSRWLMFIQTLKRPMEVSTTLKIIQNAVKQASQLKK
jgi:hypothetical protein